MKLVRNSDEKMYPVGIADGQPISLKKQLTMKGVATKRLGRTTRAEARLCSAFQSMCREIGTTRNGALILRYQREYTVHIADIVSRSLDFYFAHGRVAVEADGPSHNSEEQSAKDKWLDGIMSERARILVLRFTNKEILENTPEVIAVVASVILARHNWPPSLRNRFHAITERHRRNQGMTPWGF